MVSMWAHHHGLFVLVYYHYFRFEIVPPLSLVFCSSINEGNIMMTNNSWWTPEPPQPLLATLSGNNLIMKVNHALCKKNLFMVIRSSFSATCFPFPVTHRISFVTCPQGPLEQPIIVPAACPQEIASGWEGISVAFTCVPPFHPSVALSLFLSLLTKATNLANASRAGVLCSSLCVRVMYRHEWAAALAPWGNTSHWDQRVHDSGCLSSSRLFEYTCVKVFCSETPQQKL